MTQIRASFVNNARALNTRSLTGANTDAIDHLVARSILPQAKHLSNWSLSDHSHPLPPNIYESKADHLPNIQMSQLSANMQMHTGHLESKYVESIKVES